MNLEQILTCVDIESRTNFSNVNIEQICYSSRECGPNSLFVAIKGYRTDGHDYIADAIQKGAIAIVHSSELSDYQDNIVYIKTPHSREMLPILASNFYHHPSDYLTTFVATGTNGKTTSCSIARHIFSTFGKNRLVDRCRFFYRRRNRQSGSHHTRIIGFATFFAPSG